jgi:hypothetical protein
MSRRVAIALTLMAAGVLVIRACLDGRGADRRRAYREANSGTRVDLSPLGLDYYEDGNELELTVELGSDWRGDFYYVYVFSPSSWRRVMPEWCRNRRAAILAEIERLTRGEHRLSWVEMR